MTDKPKAKKLTPKQQKFADFFDGNATQAARDAGYKGSEKSLAVIGHENLRKLNILNAILEREKPDRDRKIASREERQEFWTSVLVGDESIVEELISEDGDKIIKKTIPKMSDRLKASELLGRSQADFTDNLDHKGKVVTEAVITFIKHKNED